MCLLTFAVRLGSPLDVPTDEVTHMTRGVPTGLLAQLGVYLLITHARLGVIYNVFVQNHSHD